jgi:hypothetical protein
MTSVASVSRITASRALRWWTGGLAFLRQAPLRLSLLALLPMVVEIAFQLVPTLGIVLSKLATPIAVVLVYLAYDNFVNARAVDLPKATRRLGSLGWDRLAGLAIISFLVYVTQILIGYLIHGEAAIDVAVFGRTEEHRELVDSRFLLTLILPGLIPATLLMFFGPLVGLARQRPGAAARMSVETMLGSPAALVVTLLVTGVLAAVAILWGYGIGVLLFAVWATATGFVAYRDVFEIAVTQSSASVADADEGAAD